MKRHSVLFVAVVIFSIMACSLKPSPEATPEVVVKDNGGPTIVTGKVNYTNAFFTDGVAQPIIILEDQTGFVKRDRNFVFPVESQVIGEITSDFYTSPFSYSLSLPSKPKGTLNDVDHDDIEETGVMIFAVAYWTNTWGDPYLERRDQFGGGWSSAYASTLVSDNRDAYLEVFGGKYLVYAPDDKQQFPSQFGDDKKLFTDDDPIMDLPAGWSVIDLDATPFGIDRSENPVIDLLEPESAALVDFSNLSYDDAFEKMVEKFKNEYAFTELKGIDWDAKADEFRLRFAEAKDPHSYALALRDFLWSIPDTHVGFDQTLLNDDFQNEIAGGLGFAMRETDDGKIIAVFVLDGGPASNAGMEWGAEIISLDGKPIADVVDATVPWSSPFSNITNKRLQQLRYATRFKLDKGQVEVVFMNPNSSEETATLDVINEYDSFSFTSFYAGQPETSLPVEFSILPSGYGYIKISSFFDNDVLTIQVWERAIKYFNDNSIPGVIIDMRVNGGGSGWLADQMAAYFFKEETMVGNTARYNSGSGEFYMDPGDEAIMIPPREELQYTGPVALLVGPACASACEFFSYDMTINDRAAIVGQYPTDGAGGSVEQFLMPEGLTVQMTIGRAVDADGNIHLEGKGVQPTVQVPVTAETLKRQADGEDVILNSAIEFLSKPQGEGVTPSAPPTIASPADAEAAFASGESFLWDVAREEYTEENFSPHTKIYTIALSESKTLIWAYAWCAKDTETVEENFKQIDVKFILAGEEIPAEQLAVYNVESGGVQCRLLYTALSDWKAGEHHFTTETTFKSNISDGVSAKTYEAGKYIDEYTVYVKP